MQTDIRQEPTTEEEPPLEPLPRLNWVGFAMVMVIVVPFALTLGVKLMAVDLAYHIRLGKLMLDTHHLIRRDTFTFTAHGRSWLDQQWGTQVLFAWLFDHGGWAAIKVVGAISAAASSVVVFLSCRAAGASRRMASALTWASLVLLLPFMFVIRPQVLAMPLFGLSVWVIAGRKAHPRRLWLLPIVTAVWANVHGTFPLPLVLLGLAWLEDRRTSYGLGSQILAVAAATLAATLINPFGPRVWAYTFSLSSNPIIRRLASEWQPPTVRTVYGVVFFVSVAAVTAVLARVRGKVPWTALLVLAVFLAVALDAIRGIVWWAMVVPVVLAAVLSQVPPRVRPDQRPSRKPGILALLASFVLLTSAFGHLSVPRTTPSKKSFTYAPVGIAQAIRADVPAGGRIFNAEKWGSWLEFALPTYPVVIDSRIEAFPKAVWDDYEEVGRGQEGWQQVLDRWQVTAVAADHWQLKDLFPRISKDPGWRLVYQDSDGALFVRSATGR